MCCAWPGIGNALAWSAGMVVEAACVPPEAVSMSSPEKRNEKEDMVQW